MLCRNESIQDALRALFQSILPCPALQIMSYLYCKLWTSEGSAWIPLTVHPKQERRKRVACGPHSCHSEERTLKCADMESKLLNSPNFPALQSIIANVKELWTALTMEMWISGKMVVSFSALISVPDDKNCQNELSWSCNLWKEVTMLGLLDNN